MNKVMNVLKSIVVHVVVFSMIVVVGFVMALGLVTYVEGVNIPTMELLHLCSYGVMISCVSYVVFARLITWLKE